VKEIRAKKKLLIKEKHEHSKKGKVNRSYGEKDANEENNKMSGNAITPLAPRVSEENKAEFFEAESRKKNISDRSHPDHIIDELPEENLDILEGYEY
jgi:hypothetical protein